MEINKEFVFFTISYAIIISLLIYSPYQLHILGLKILELSEENHNELQALVNDTKKEGFYPVQTNGTHVMINNTIYKLG